MPIQIPRPSASHSLSARLGGWLRNLVQWAASPRGRRAGGITASVIVLFGISAWFGVPPLVRSIATHQASAWLERPVTLGQVRFNPFTLRLDVEQLHVGDRGGDQRFVDIDGLTVNLSWSSLFRLAAIVDSITVTHPQIRIERSAEQRFNFTDLIEKASQGPKQENSKPVHFALHNIKVSDGDIVFDDRVTQSQHHIGKLQLGIPFIANLPSAIKIDVQPLLQMVVDGSPFSISGKTRPFAETHESVVDIRLDQLDLTRYLSYVPVPLPVKIPEGLLSSNLQLHFIDTQPQMMISLSGAVALDKLRISDRKDAALLELKHAAAQLADVQPLRNLIHLGDLKLDGLTVHAAINHDGRNNFQSLTTTSGASQPAEKSGKKPADKAAKPLDLSIASASLDNGAVQFTDARGAKPASTAVDGIRLRLQKFDTLGKTPASANLDLHFADGSISLQGKLTPSTLQASASLKLQQINLASLQPFLQQQLNGVLKSGVLNAEAQMEADLRESSRMMQVHPATASINDLEFRSGKDTPLRWQRLQVTLDQLDLDQRKAAIGTVTLDQLKLLAHREADGSINLAKLLRSSGADTRPSPDNKATADKPWQFGIAGIAVNDANVKFLDDAAPSPVKLEIAPLNLSLKGLSSDLSKDATLELSGGFPRKGQFKVSGTVAPSPLKTDLRIQTRNLDIAALGAYAEKLNATIASAALSSNLHLKLGKNTRDQLRLGLYGNATLGKVRVLDKVTDDDFINWNAFTANGIKVRLDGDQAPFVHVNELALSDFFARLIMSASGKLNLQDIMAGNAGTPTSITQDSPAAEAGSTTPAEAAPAPEPSTAPASPPANISLGQITLQGGQVRYSDHFIKPNYTATISSITGKVGAFGTQSATPAEVLMQGEFDHNAPLTISGSINPLAPTASVDITAKAGSVELTDLTSYSTKYAGYPLTKGKLSFDVRYQLQQGQLTADNHIYIDQLTFGDHVAGPDATKLPVQLAVSLLKDANGVIDLHVPVSGSVSDPEFSLGGVILRAFVNLIAKAALSPFSLLSSAFGGGDTLSHVLFDPGLAVLTPETITHLDTLAKALSDRPALKLDISGRADPELDKPGLREAMVNQRVKRQLIRDTVGKGDSVDPSTLQVPAEAYDKYLKRAYDAEDFPKPRNFIGIAKSLPPEEMKKLMLANMPVTDESLQNLAEQRAENVRKYLAAKVDPNRLFVVAPKLDSKGIDDKDKTTRVDFSLK